MYGQNCPPNFFRGAINGHFYFFNNDKTEKKILYNFHRLYKGTSKIFHVSFIFDDKIFNLSVICDFLKVYRICPA